MKTRTRTPSDGIFPPVSLPRYQTLPSFGIYADQLLSFVNEAVSPLMTPEEKHLTASMVNNYVKQGVMPKPFKKKYTRDHIAYLIVVCILKKVFSIQEITRLIQIQIRNYPTDKAYDSFIEAVEASMARLFSPAAGEYDTEQDNAIESEGVPKALPYGSSDQGVRDATEDTGSAEDKTSTKKTRDPRTHMSERDIDSQEALEENILLVHRAVECFSCKLFVQIKTAASAEALTVDPDCNADIT